jgi:2-methylaconitate cis-trans-isomerase PrpF
MLRAIPCVLMRGGSSKGLYFSASDLPSDSAMRDRVLLAALGSPDVRQIDGLGGGDDQSSKVVIIEASQRTDIDVECLFAQVSVSREVVDRTPNSGNMLSGVGPYAIERGLVRATDPFTIVRILNRNTGRTVEARVQTPGGRVSYGGDHALDDLPGHSAPLALQFLEPAGTTTGKLLPTGNAVDVIDGVAVSCVDFAIPVVMVAASELGKTGHESKQELDADAALLTRLEQLRRSAARLMQLGDVAGKAVPKIMLLAPPRDGGTLASRYFTPSTCHSGHALTGALCLIAACNIPGTVAARIANHDGADLDRIVIEHPSGTLAVNCEVGARDEQGRPFISRASVVTTARPIFTGLAFVRESAFNNP